MLGRQRCAKNGDHDLTDASPTPIFLTNTPESASVRIYQCQRSWKELQASERADVRFCDHCHQNVHRVLDVDGFERAVARAQCVMVAGFDSADKSRKLYVGQPGGVGCGVYASLPVQDD
jgi:hypothetical protein